MFVQYRHFRVHFVRSLKPARLWLCLALLAVTSGMLASMTQPALAATNTNLNFQARLQTASGGIVADGLYNVEFKLYSASSGGSALWTETYLNSNTQGVRVKNGYLTTNLGSVTAFPGTINWDQELWITMTVRGTGSCAFGACTPTDAEMNPRLKLTGVPYAFKAGQLAKFNSVTGFTSTLELAAPTGGNQTFQVADQGAAGTYTLLTTAAAAGSYIQNTNSPQTANYNITGNGTVGGNMAVTGTYNTNTFTSSALTFGAASAASVQSASGQSLTLDSGTTAALNIGTNANAKTVTIGNASGATSLVLNTGTGGVSIGANGVANTLQLGNTTGAVAQTINVGNNATASSVTTLNLGSIIGASATNIRGGSGNINVLGTTYINNSGSSTTYIGNGTATGDVRIGNQNGGNNVYFQASNIVLDAGVGNGGNLSGIGNLAFNGTVNANTFTSSALTFGSAGAASIRSANTYALTVDSGTTGGLNLGTGANAKTITLGNNTGATALFLNAGSGGINIGANSNNPINLATGTSTALVTLGSGNGTFALDTTNIDISAAGAITGVTGLNMASGNFSQAGSGTFSTGTGIVSLNGATVVRSDLNNAFQIQNAAGTIVYLNYSSTLQRLTLRSQSDSSTLGSELMTGTFPATAGWTAISGTGQTATATHTNGGGTTTLSPTPALSIAAGTSYKLEFTVSGLSTNGAMSVSFGGVVANLLRGNGAYSYVVTTTTTGNLIFAPSSPFNGTVSGVSAKQITNIGTPFTISDSAGVTAVSLRVSQAAGLSMYLGSSAGAFSGTGIGNTGIGAYAMQDNSSGSYNTALGYSALSASGGGDDNTAIGYRAAGSLIAGSRNTAIGSSALYSVKSGTGNTALGYNAGNQDLAGYTTATDLSNTTLIGNYAQSQISNALILGGAGVLDAVGSNAVRVGIGTNRPANLFSVMPTQYDTGTITQSGNTVTGSGTTFTAAMVGGRFTTTGGTNATVTGFTSATSITINVSQTIASPSNYRIHRIGLQVTDEGAVGVGTEAPGYRFDVADNQSASYVARIQNTNTANTADGLLIDLGVANASRGTGNYFVGFAGSGTVAGKIQGGASAVAYTTTAADYAEYFRADPDDLPVAAELVQIDKANNSSVIRSGVNSQLNLVGVVSTNPGFIGNGPLCQTDDEDCDTNYAKYNALVALSGQVPVKVNDSKGDIEIGDPITVSSVAGEGAKASVASYIVGYAQEALEGASGTVKVLIRPQYYTPPSTVDLTEQINDLQSQVDGFGSLLNTGGIKTGALTVTGNANIKGDLVVLGKTIVRELQIEGHIISKGDLPTVELQPAAGKKDAPDSADEATVGVTGNDTAGVITVRAGLQSQGQQLLKLSFNKSFTATPQVLITPVGQSGASLQAYVDNPADDGFTIGVVGQPQAGQTYRFNYYVIQ